MNHVSQHIADLRPYQPGMSLQHYLEKYGVDADSVVRLASNENPFGASKKVTAVLSDISNVARYPDGRDLIAKVADFYDIAKDSIVLGNGSNDVIDIIARSFLNDGDEAISSQYAFVAFGIATQIMGATNVVIPAKEFHHDLDAMFAAITDKTRIIWLANPNNPTGTFEPYQKVREFLAKVPDDIIVVLDEAYYEYLNPDTTQDTLRWVKEFPQLIIIRTFSKVYGLAGLRVGYGVADPQITAILQRVRQPFNVSSVAILAAIAALEDQRYVTNCRIHNTQELKRVTEQLHQLPVNIISSAGNFVTFGVENANEVNEMLLQQGVIIRPLVGYGMQQYLRMTIGTTEENDIFVSALTDILKK